MKHRPTFHALVCPNVNLRWQLWEYNLSKRNILLRHPVRQKSRRDKNILCVYLDLRDRKQQETGEICLMTSLIIWDGDWIVTDYELVTVSARLCLNSSTPLMKMAVCHLHSRHRENLKSHSNYDFAEKYPCPIDPFPVLSHFSLVSVYA
jgi:hypothetical protein